MLFAWDMGVTDTKFRAIAFYNDHIAFTSLWRGSESMIQRCEIRSMTVHPAFTAFFIIELQIGKRKAFPWAPYYCNQFPEKNLPDFALEWLNQAQR
jgi:hypothetical protein